MYIAMNRFHIIKGKEEEFETIWKNRDSQLNSINGFISFKLIKGPSNDQYTLYISHSTWKSKNSFIEWTKSESFRKTHKNVGDHSDKYIDAPKFEGFKVIL